MLKKLDDLLFPGKKEKLVGFENYSLWSGVRTNADIPLHHLRSGDLKKCAWAVAESVCFNPAESDCCKSVPQVSVLKHRK